MCEEALKKYIRGSRAPDCRSHSQYKNIAEYNLFSPGPIVNCVADTSASALEIFIFNIKSFRFYFFHFSVLKPLVRSDGTKQNLFDDGISHKMLKGVSKSVSKPLSMLMNRSFNEGIFPDIWKLANVIPIFKKGDKSQPCNYRPVALLSCIGKLQERIVFKICITFS